jgi:hypothetical protein
MGKPGRGWSSLIHNNINNVISYFEKNHQLKIKIYNFCSDMNYNALNLQNRIQLAYFPIIDNSPAPLSLIFKFTVDAMLYLAYDPDNIIAVHCN